MIPLLFLAEFLAEVAGKSLFNDTSDAIFHLYDSQTIVQSLSKRTANNICEKDFSKPTHRPMLCATKLLQ
jgi:hypothetical protein